MGVCDVSVGYVAFMITGMAPGTCNFFLSLKKEILKMQGGGSRTPSLAPQTGMITTQRAGWWN